MGCVNYYQFLNETVLGYQFFTTQGWTLLCDDIRQLLSFHVLVVCEFQSAFG